MAINPMLMMQMAGRFKKFNQEHPKVAPFLRAADHNVVCEGAVVELKITSPDGQEFVTNIKLTADDIETINALKNAK